MTYSVYVFTEPYNSKSVGARQSVECNDDKAAIDYCSKAIDRPDVREVNAFTMAGRLVCNIYKSDKIKIDEKI
jgi:hypothetical protein